MNYIIFDLEWNQCPYGKGKENSALSFEILEIGAVKLNESFQETDQFHEMIHPNVYHDLHFRTKEILQMEIEDFASARPFPEVMADFLEWCGSDAYFCIWGSLDLTELQRNMRYYKMPIPFPFPLRYLDIQKIFSIAMEDGKSRKSLEYAVDYLALDKEAPFHSALADAVYTAWVMEKLPKDILLENYSIDYFCTPKNRKEEFLSVFPTYSKFVSKPFSDKTIAMKDRKVTSTQCYLCGNHARRKIRWFSSGTKSYYSLSYCEEHGWLKGKIRVKKNEEGKLFCIKTLKLISEEDANALYEKQALLREKKRLKRHALAQLERSRKVAWKKR